MLAAAAVIGLFWPSAPARAEEGMWTFETFPLARVNAAYGLRLDQAWLDRVRGAAVRLNGCSGSILSPEGLVLTNAHCVAPCLQDLTERRQADMETGFAAAARDEERTCPGQTADVLVDVQDVTDRMTAAAADQDGATLLQVLYRTEEAIKQEACGGDARFTCQVVDFHHGGRYALYKYRTYRDVRLVFTPEPSVSSFGGDPDNFNFPRYSLDFAFLRLYDDDRPAATPQNLRWSSAAPREGEPTFVAGNPAMTLRQLTSAQLLRQRDQGLPILVGQLAELRGRLLQYSETGSRQAEAAATALAGVENSYKVVNGQLSALLDDDLIQAKRAEEDELRQAAAADPALVDMMDDRRGDPWTVIARAQTAARDLYPTFRQLEAAAGSGSGLYSYARVIVRVSQERAKPPEERRPGYSDAYFAAVARKLAIDKPIQSDLERLNLTFWLQKTRELLTVDDPNVRALLGDESPEALAERLVKGTRLDDPDMRVAMLAMTPDELAATGDPMIAFVMANDMAAQLARTEWELAVEAPVTRAQEQIARARFAVYGDEVAPDATFTLRLSYGKVAGWTQGRRTVEPFTRVAGLYDRATDAAPFRLPESWVEARETMNPQTPFAYVTTNDIAGGNSGSPVLNARGEVIGTAFDGNIHAIAGTFAYDERLNRTVALSTTVMTEALRDVYHQTHLLKELGQR
ncbi:S46 family peptidase [Brevundimonas sp.]|uniref:S46 family peptidase n=1 Tax=Brevundimonas sp. TaxID=1871086 RepID=UPI002FD9959A